MRMADSNSNDVENNYKSSFTAKPLDFKIAARLVVDAKDLRNIPFKQSESDLKFYEAYLNKWVVIAIYLTIIVHIIVLPFFEEPAYVTNTPYWVPCMIEFICLFIYLCRWMHSKIFQTNKDFFGDKKNIVILVIIILTAIDLTAFVVVKYLDIEFAHRYTRFLRVLFYINFNEGKELRRAFRNVRRTLPDILNVFVLFITSLIVFSFLGWQLFKKKNLKYPNKLEYFTKFEDAIWDMYVAVTTANFPDVMMPAYSISGVYALFFIVFMLINLYIFINIILATIYSNYKKHLKNEIKSTIQLKRSKLEQAFNLLRTDTSSTSQTQTFGVEVKTFTNLVSLIDPLKNEFQIKTLFHLLDLDNDRILNLKEFLYLADLLNVRITEVTDRQIFFQRHFPYVYESRPSQILRTIVRHKFFTIPFDILILLNVVFLIVNIDKAEWFFLSAFIIEILLKLYAFGAKAFFSRYWNIFDMVIIVIGLIVGIIEASIKSGTSSEVLEIILILRLLRLLKLLSSFKRFRVVITTIVNITPSLLTYATLILTIYYIFGMIGMEIFGKTIKSKSSSDDFVDCSNTALIDTDFAKLKYCKNNFENVLNTVILMFELMVVNQWHVLTQGFVTVTTKWARLFFVFFHISCVIVSLNIFTAFVLEAFLLEYETNEKTLFETRIEQKIIELGLNLDSDTPANARRTSEEKLQPEEPAESVISTIFKSYHNEVPVDISKIEGTKFHLNPKGPKPVEILLQRMFSQEFDITQDDLMN